MNEASPAIEPAASAALDLKRSLALRIVAVVLACFLGASALAMFATYRDVRQANEKFADLVLGQLRAQLFRIESNIDVMAHFPDWSQVAEIDQSPGQCVRYLTPAGRIGNSSCVGFDLAASGAPAWFYSVSNRLLSPRIEVTRPISYRGRPYGAIVVTTQPAAVVAAVWKKVSALLGFTALVIVAISILQYVVIARALRPTREILGGIDRLARGELSYRLPRFRLVELQRLSTAFNALAAGLDRSIRERTELAAKLVDSQERERLHLAHELHDELAQYVSAMSAIAGSIRLMAETANAPLAAEAERLTQTSAAIMASLSGTLRALRPPEIEDFGLAAGLSALAVEQERRARGELGISLEIDDEVDALPPTAAAHVYRIVQEGLTNVAKHARASRARVTLRFRPGPAAEPPSRRRWLAVTVEDDGKGAAPAAGAATADRFGLAGMRERVMALGGRMETGVSASGGFRLHAIIPFATEAREAS